MKIVCESGVVTLAAFLVLSIAACAPAIHSANTAMDYTAPKWTIENPNAEKNVAPAVRGQKSPAVAEGSLEALRSGQSTATPASSPLKEIYFGFDRADLSPEARAVLGQNAEWLKKNSASRVQIEGHCDARGTAEYNLALGAKRAQAALDYLSTLGVAKDRMTTISYGHEIPVCGDATEECWAKNRRARFVVVGVKSAP